MAGEDVQICMPRSRPPAWAAAYVGLPFKEHGRDRGGVDCWGLFRLVMAERFALDLPSYADGYESTADAEELGRLIRGGLGPWRPVRWGHERAGDGLLIRMKAQPMHVAVVAAPGWMLHVEDGVDSSLERYDGVKWRRRILGVYRHERAEAG